MTKYIFDLDGTVTKEETLPIISKYFNVSKEMEELTKRTVQGEVPFVESFIKRCYILGNLSVKEVANLLENVKLYSRVLGFIQEHKSQCIIATGNLSCWTHKLAERIGCEFYCSEAIVRDDKVIKLKEILKKEDLVSKYKKNGDRVVFIGDGNNDVEAMRKAEEAASRIAAASDQVRSELEENPTFSDPGFGSNDLDFAPNEPDFGAIPEKEGFKSYQIFLTKKTININWFKKN